MSGLLRLMDEFRRVETSLVSAHGPVSLFALVQREGSAQRWDVVIAADWVDRLLADLSREAAGDRAVRSALTHAGWDIRPA